MNKRQINIICAYTPDELSEGFSNAFSRVLFDKYLKDRIYEEVETIIHNLKQRLQTSNSAWGNKWVAIAGIAT